MERKISISKPSVGEEEVKAVSEVIRSGIIAQGPQVSKLEEEFSKLCNSEYSIAVNSGTAALHTSLNVAGINGGDEVITTPFTFIATANTIMMQNAKPVFVDIDEDSFNLNPDLIEEKITDKTRAIVTVDLYGQLCDYIKINEIANKYNLVVISDSCQSIGAEQESFKSGSIADITAFSFYATKNITCGEGGILTTNNEDYEKKARLFRQHGRSDLNNYDYTHIGYNYRTTDINASILLEQLKKLSDFTNKRISNANYLLENLKDIPGLVLPKTFKNNKHVFHQFTIKINSDFKMRRDDLVKYFKDKGINCGVYYPKSIHLFDHLIKFGYQEGDFPVAERLSGEVISLPVHPELSRDDLNYIVSSINGVI
tara:strand:- start:9302 stop:10411 length:1110 start_codon:yes stop_codon:yes gene_type:complete